jgi:thiol-disulfide isomerase/thioredoxin
MPDQTNDTTAKSTPPWISLWNFIGRPDVFFDKIAEKPRLWYGFAIPLLLSLLLPVYAFSLIGLTATLNPVFMSFCSFAVLLMQNALYAACATLLSKVLGGNATYKTLFVACSFAQIPYALLKVGMPVMLVLIWSFLLSILAVQQATRLIWFKSFVLQIALFGFSIGLTMASAPHAAKLVYNLALQNARKARQQATATDQNQAQPGNSGEGRAGASSVEHPPAPNIILHLANGTNLPLSSLKGKVVVLDFWATWCPPCRRGLPMVAQVAMGEHDRGVEFFAINTTDSKEVAEKYLRKNNLDVPLVLDQDKSNAMALRAFNIPYIVIINKKGNIQSIHEGYSPSEADALRLEIDAALAD